MPEFMEKDYYNILGVNKNATQDEIKSAFRNLSKKYHPDRKDGNEEKFKEVNEAYSILGDEQKRKEYDNRGNNERFWNGFDSMFNNGGRFGGGFRYMNMASDMSVTISVTIDDAYYGCKVPIRSNGKLLNIDVPKGTMNGQKLRIAGYGKRGYDMSGNITNGDLIVTVMIKCTDKLWLNGDGSLEMMCAIDWLDAILGCEMTVELFDRNVTFRVPKYTQNGGYTIVSNQGYRKFKKDDMGMLKVNFIVKMPKKLKDSQIKLLEKIKEG